MSDMCQTAAHKQPDLSLLGRGGTSNKWPVLSMATAVFELFNLKNGGISVNGGPIPVKGCPFCWPFEVQQYILPS